MLGCQYLNQLIPATQASIQKYFSYGYLNILDCYTGSGKTVWAVDDLSQYQINRNHNCRILMITDTISNKRSLIINHKEYTQIYHKSIRDIINNRIETWGQKEVMVMTYAQLAVLLHFGNTFNWNFLDFVIFDEIHCLMEQKKFKIQDNNGIDVFIDIKTILCNQIIRSLGKNTYIIGMTATPETIYNSYLNRYVKIVLSDAERDSLFHYEVKKWHPYSDLNNILNLIPLGHKGIIYLDYVATMERAYNLLKDKGHKVDLIWSINNEKHRDKMTDDRKDIINEFVENHRIRNDLDILIINKAYYTGLKFDTRIDFMITHSYVAYIIKQVIGRYKGDLDLVCYPDKNVNDILVIPREYLYSDLYSEDKEKLCIELDLKNKKNGRLLKWASIKKIIEEQKIYKIIDGKRKGNKRSEKIVELL